MSGPILPSVRAWMGFAGTPNGTDSTHATGQPATLPFNPLPTLALFHLLALSARSPAPLTEIHNRKRKTTTSLNH